MRFVLGIREYLSGSMMKRVVSFFAALRPQFSNPAEEQHLEVIEVLVVVRVFDVAKLAKPPVKVPAVALVRNDGELAWGVLHRI